MQRRRLRPVSGGGITLPTLLPSWQVFLVHFLQFPINTSVRQPAGDNLPYTICQSSCELFVKLSRHLMEFHGKKHHASDSFHGGRAVHSLFIRRGNQGWRLASTNASHGRRPHRSCLVDPRMAVFPSRATGAGHQGLFRHAGVYFIVSRRDRGNAGADRPVGGSGKTTTGRCHAFLSFTK